MASPSYGIDVVAFALAVILAAAVLFLLAQIVPQLPQLADLMMMPPPLSGTWVWTIDSAFHNGRDQTHGFEATREAAMQAFPV